MHVSIAWIVDPRAGDACNVAGVIAEAAAVAGGTVGPGVALLAVLAVLAVLAQPVTTTSSRTATRCRRISFPLARRRSHHAPPAKTRMPVRL
jgi:hypothetical protein